MIRKMVCFVFSAVVLVFLACPASAATGSIRVDIGGSGEVTLYHVGEPEDVNYRLLQQYGGGLVTFDDVLSPNLAAWLAQRAAGGIAMETEHGAAEFEGMEEGLYLVVQSGLREGYYAFSPFLVSLPWDGYVWDVDASPKMELIPTETPKTGDASAILLPIGGMAFSLLGLAECWKKRKKY